MGFIFDGLDTESYDREYSDRDLLRRIVSYFRPFGRKMALVALMLTLQSVAGSGRPIVIAKAIDQVAETPTIYRMAFAASLLLIFGAAAWVTNFIRQWHSARVVGDVVLQLRADALDATIRHDMPFFDKHPTGKIVSRVTSDTQAFSDVVGLVINLISQVLIIIIIIIWLFNINIGLTLLLLGMSPIAVVIALVAKSFRKEQAIFETFEDNNQQAYHVGLRRGLTFNTIYPIMGVASGLATAMLVFAAGLRIQTSAISPGEWYLFMLAVGFFWYPLMGIASFWSQFQDGLSAAERVFALIDAEPDVEQVANEPVEELEGLIEFRNLRFSYSKKEIVLPDFSLIIHPGETLALVGHTGAGKSSIAKLITRFYEYQEGELLVDGRDIRRLDLDVYRRNLGLVPQDPFLFSGTVAENIRYSRPEATEKDVCQAAEHISGGEWLADLPNGLETNAGERGANLSMGQRQLVALARVLLKDPAILILDEATASVDPFTEVQIQSALQQVMRGRTSVVIAHRLWTVQNADRIIILDHGRIIGDGTHSSLMAEGGHYADLYNTYFRHQSLEYIESMGN